MYTYSDLVAELPFILMHPKPDDTDDNILIDEISPNNNGTSSKGNGVGDKQHAVNNNSTVVKDDTPNLIQLDG